MAGDVEGVARRAAQCAALGVETGAACRAAGDRGTMRGPGKRNRHKALLATVKGGDRACTRAQESAVPGGTDRWRPSMRAAP